MASFGYTYDDNKNKLTETLGAPMANYGFDSTTYDNEDRLTAWSRVDDNKDQEWELSAAGDWDSFTEEAVEVERTHNDVHELTAVGATNLAHDAKGNLTKDGAQTHAKYIWDFDNRLHSVDTDDDDTSEVFYTYDALGRRITKSIVVLSGYGAGSRSPGISRRSAGGRSITRRGASTSVTTTTVFVPDGQQEVAEYTHVSTVGVPNLTKKYVYAAYIDEPVLMLNVSGETETKYYYHQNSLYSVAALTDQSGTVVERYSYLAYGNITFHDADGSVADPQSSTVANPYLFTGRRFDSETGLQYSRARYYHFNLGRWISRDPIGYEGGINLYRYVGNNPLNATDPSGEDDDATKPTNNAGDAINRQTVFENWRNGIYSLYPASRLPINYKCSYDRMSLDIEDMYGKFPFEWCVVTRVWTYTAVCKCTAKVGYLTYTEYIREDVATELKDGDPIMPSPGMGAAVDALGEALAETGAEKKRLEKAKSCCNKTITRQFTSPPGLYFPWRHDPLGDNNKGHE